MNFCGIISEFNPFHNGHEYLINMAKQITGLPVMCIMSGNFVQRGEAAIIDKYIRAKCAISSGADIVVELPTVYALSNAQSFAYGAVKCLKELGCTHLVIGVTHTNLDDYYNLAKIKNANIKSAIKTELEKGTNYSKALINVLKIKYKNCDKIFTDASNILALEYIEQVINQNAKMQILLVNRTDGGYSSKSIRENYANATTLRSLILSNKTELCKKFIPAHGFVQLNNLSDTSVLDYIILHELRKFSAEELNNFYDYTEGLHYLISNNVRSCKSIEDAITACNSKRYRPARLKKLFIYPILNITKSAVEKIMNGKIVVRLLAIKKNQKQFISLFNKKYIKVVVSYADLNKLTKSQKLSMQIDLDASNLYSLCCGKPYNSDIKTGTLFLD